MAIKLPKSKVKCQNSARVPSWKFGYHVSFYRDIWGAWHRKCLGLTTLQRLWHSVGCLCKVPNVDMWWHGGRGVGRGHRWCHDKFSWILCEKKNKCWKKLNISISFSSSRTKNCKFVAQGCCCCFFNQLTIKCFFILLNYDFFSNNKIKSKIAIAMCVHAFILCCYLIPPIIW